MDSIKAQNVLNNQFQVLNTIKTCGQYMILLILAKSHFTNYSRYQSLLEFIVCMAHNDKSTSSNHLFSLVRLKPDCKILPTVVDFTPPLSTSHSCRSAAPCFNHDSCPSTPCFTLFSEQKSPEKEAHSQKISFQRRMSEILSHSNIVGQKCQQVIQGVVPHSNYCQICQEYFKSYQDHLEQKGHILRWKNNQFNDDILYLCHPKPSHQREGFAKKKPIHKERKMSLKTSSKTMTDYESKRRMSAGCELECLELYGEVSLAVPQLACNK